MTAPDWLTDEAVLAPVSAQFLTPGTELIAREDWIQVEEFGVEKILVGRRFGVRGHLGIQSVTATIRLPSKVAR